MLLLEDGTGVINSSSYVSLEDFQAHISNTGIDTTLSDDQKSSVLNDAAFFLDTNITFIGSRLKEEQGLEFPRVERYNLGIYSRTGNPTISDIIHPKYELKKAILYLASYNLVNNETTSSVSNPRVKRLKEKLDATAEIDTTYEDGDDAVDKISVVRLILKKYITPEFIKLAR